MSDDTISRQEVLDAVDERLMANGYSNVALVSELNKLYGILAKLPAAERRGRWIDHGSFEVCSVCGEEQYGHDNGRHYCPNCGAKMDDDWEEPAINPCQGCEDYDGRGGCISKGGCGAKMMSEDEEMSRVSEMEMAYGEYLNG